MENKLCIQHSDSISRLETKIDSLIDTNDNMYALLKIVIESDIKERTNTNNFFYKIVAGVVGVVSTISLGAFGINQIIKFI